MPQESVSVKVFVDLLVPQQSFFALKGPRTRETGRFERDFGRSATISRTNLW